MARRKPDGLHSRWRAPEPLQTHIKLAAMAATAALPLLLLASLFPRPLVLPVACLIAVFGAAIASFVAWRRGAVRNSQNVTAWDVAGALTFIACASAIMSDPTQVAHLTDAVATMNQPPGSSKAAMLSMN
jgi:hypothetical protein